jgi:chromosome partitioning protein
LEFTVNIVTIASLKGGVGKTIHAAHLSVALEAMGQGPVGCIDLDPQATFTAWWKDRKHAETPIFAKVEDYTQLGPKLASMKKKFKWVIIDTPPQIADINREAVRQANLVLIPCKSGKGDMVASLDTVAICKELKQEFFYILNEVKGKRTADTAVKKLATKGKVAPVVIPDLDGYWQSMWTGHTLPEIAQTTGAIVIQQLAEFVVSQFEELPAEEKVYA